MRDSYQSRPSAHGPEAPGRRARRTGPRLLTLAATVAVLVLTLWPGAAGEHSQRLCPVMSLVCGDKWAVDVVLNLLLFLPLGFGLRRAGLGLIAAAGTAATLSVLLELAQLGVVPGRDPSLRDVLANGAGALAGAWLGGMITRLVHPEPRAAWRYTLVWGAGATLLLLAAAYLLRPSLPDSLWYGQHRAELGGYDRFEGELLGAAMSGKRLPSGPLMNRARPGGAEGELELAARITIPPGPTGRLAPILSVFDGDRRRVAILGQVGSDLAFAARIRGEDLGFEGLMVRRHQVFAQPAGDTIEVIGRRVGGVIEIAVRSGTGGPQEVAERYPTGPADAWRLIGPREMALSPLVGILGRAAGLALLFAPLGWWSRATGARRLLLAGALPALVALWPIPLGFPVASWPTWVGVLGGIVSGWVAAGLRPADGVRSTTSHEGTIRCNNLR